MLERLAVIICCEPFTYLISEPILSQEPLMKKLAVVCSAVILASVLLSQFTTVAAQEKTATKTPTSTQKSTISTGKSVFMIVCDAKPGQLLVLNEKGEWISTVKAVEINMEIGKKATVSCTMWSGQFKPTNPDSKTWELQQLRSVSAAQFQTYIDKLQVDPAAITREN